MAIAVGAPLDGIPESIVDRAEQIEGGVVSLGSGLVAIFLSNIPEGLSSASGMKKAGRSTLYVMRVWGVSPRYPGWAALVGFACSAGSRPRSLPPPRLSRRVPSSPCSWIP